MNCFAELKVHDTLSSWCCYVFAMNDDETIVHCILYSDAMGLEIATQSIQEIFSRYNQHGEFPVVDTEFRRMKVFHLIEKLQKNCTDMHK